MNCWTQFWCRHEWKHRFIVDGCDTAISCYCWRCSKTKLATHFYPWSDDEILIRSHDAFVASDLIKKSTAHG